MHIHVRWLATLALLFSIPAAAEVTRVDVLSRADVAFPGYEKIVGRVFFAVDPLDPRNAVVVDLDKAPRNAAGRVEFSADFYIVRPKTAGNGAAIVDIVNRGGKTVIPNFNRVGRRDPDVGDGFLMRHGYIVAAVGWEFDLSAEGDLVRIDVPVASDAGVPITGVVRGSFTPDGTGPYGVGDLIAYTPSDPDGPDSVLTVRDSMAGAAEVVTRERWQLAGRTVTVTGGFEPGRIYELSYKAANPPVGGLGFVAVRDFASWIKHEPSALASARYVYSFGNSQSGRFLRTFLYQGFNADERGRQVLDATLINIAGSARLDLNRRWSTPTSASAMATEFPFANQALADPVSGVTDGLLENSRAAGHQPKIFLTNTSVEYWNSSGRVAALTHAMPDGSADIELPANTRAYLFAGTQHGPSAFPPEQGRGQERPNPTDYWWFHRALLVAMDNWVRTDAAPPQSQVPTLKRRTLVGVKELAFPAIPGVQSPLGLSAAARLPNPFAPGGAGAGAPLPLLVPQVDEDGNELAGVRHPEVTVPLGTFTGWNFRSPAIGGTHQTVSLLGSYVPFARTKAEREQRGDPRRSIQERYSSRDRYVSKVKDAAEELVRDRYLLAEDVRSITQRAEAFWEVATRAPAATTTSAR